MRRLCEAFAPPFLCQIGGMSCWTLFHRRQRQLHSGFQIPYFRRKLTSSASQFRADASQISADLANEIETARIEARPYQIDKSKISNAEWEMVRRRSKAIPLVADSEPIDIVFEDDNYLVVNKPSFLKMHPAHRFEGGSLLNRAIGYLGFTPWLLHRLDMHTTGVVVLAKKKQLCKPIMQQFRDGDVRKEYLCVVDGVRDSSIGSSFTVDAPIQRHEIKFMREIGSTKTDSKEAVTTYKILEKSDSANMMVLQASPQTGRTHQIRLHGRECGHPIVGDDLYNPTEHAMYSSPEEITLAARDEKLLRYGGGNALRKRLKLHAWKICFRSPLNGHAVSFCAAPPDHMCELVRWAGMELALPET